jgi:hypothetical protein
MQGETRKSPCISLDSFGRFESFQRVTANPNEKILLLLDSPHGFFPARAKCSSRRRGVRRCIRSTGTSLTYISIFANTYPNPLAGATGLRIERRALRAPGDHAKGFPYGAAAERPHASPPSPRLLFTVHGFARGAAPVAADDRDVFCCAGYAAFASAAFPLRGATLGEGACGMRRYSWTHDDLAGQSRSGNKD